MAAPDDRAHLESIPWCENLIRDPEYIVTPLPSRKQTDKVADNLFSITLKTDDTIKACLLLYRRPSPGSIWIDEAITLFSLGDGINGSPQTCHGGIIGTLIDETMGMLLRANKDRDPVFRSATAYLNVTYIKPIPTPTTVLVSVKFREVKRRKYYLDAWVKDGSQTVLAKAEALWIGISEKRKEKL